VSAFEQLKQEFGEYFKDIDPVEFINEIRDE